MSQHTPYCDGTHHFCADADDEKCGICGGTKPSTPGQMTPDARDAHAVGDLAWKMISILHSHLPEDKAPKGWADFSDEQIDRAFGAAEAVKAMVRADCARLIFEDYTRKVGEMMHQAEHWAMPEHEMPNAVHHRLHAAQDYFQVVCQFDPAKLQQGYREPFAEIEATLSRPPINKPGAYPGSAELSIAYWSPTDVAKRLEALHAKGIDRG